jgi:hypothetical protein
MVDPHMDEVREEWRIILKSFINFTLPNTGKVIKSRRMKYTGHIACIGRMKCIQRWVDNAKRNRQLARHRHRGMLNTKIHL